MTHRTVVRSALAFFVTLFLSVPAQAQLFRAYLAPSGDDNNLCTLLAPCRLLPKALAVVADGGEIWMLDSANYNNAPVNITKSVTILAVPGALGSVVATGGNAVNIATAGVEVVLRNLVIVPVPGMGGNSGIVMTAGASLTVENCLIANLPGGGIVVTGASVQVTDTTIRDNGAYGLWLQNGARGTVTRATLSGNTNAGVLVYGVAPSTTTTADIADATLDGNNGGVLALSANATATVKVSVKGSRAVQNGNSGLSASSTAGAAVTLSASDNVIANNVAGISAFNAGSKIWARENTISENGVGFQNSGALFESTGDNAVRNNSVDAFGSIGVVATK